MSSFDVKDFKNRWNKCKDFLGTKNYEVKEVRLGDAFPLWEIEPNTVVSIQHPDRRLRIQTFSDPDPCLIDLNVMRKMMGFTGPDKIDLALHHLIGEAENFSKVSEGKLRAWAKWKLMLTGGLELEWVFICTKTVPEIRDYGWLEPIFRVFNGMG